MANFGSDYEETISGFGVVCDVCGAEVESISSVYDLQGSHQKRSWRHTVEYHCGAKIYYQAGFHNEHDYRLQGRCLEAHDIALALKKKVESAQAALIEK